MKKNLTLPIAFGAVAIALSVCLNLVTIFTMPNGGSITLFRVLPLVIYAYIFGMTKGFFIGATYGVLDFMLKPYPIINIVQFLCDYPIPFGLVCLAGLFRNTKSQNKILFGTFMAAVGRFVPTVIAGMFWAKAMIVEDGFLVAFWYSFTYNTVLLVDTLIVAVAVFVLERHKPFMNFVNRIKLDTKPREKTENSDDFVV